MKKYKILSTSKNTISINRVLNEIAETHPEYEKMISYACLYELQVWASEKRKELDIDVCSLEKALADNSEYFGLRNFDSKSLSYQKRSLRLTEEMLFLFDSMFSDEGLRDEQLKIINSAFCGEKVSKKVIDETKEFAEALEETLLMLFEKYNDEFSKIANQIDEINNELDPEMKIAFHDTQILFELISILGRNRYRMYDLDKKSACEIMRLSIQTLGTYPFSDQVKRITMEVFRGKTIYRIQTELGRHRDFVKERYLRGLEALECIFWGYTYNERTYDLHKKDIFEFDV